MLAFILCPPAILAKYLAFRRLSETINQNPKQKLPLDPRRYPVHIWKLLYTQMGKMGDQFFSIKDGVWKLTQHVFLLRSWGVHTPLGNQVGCRREQRIVSGNVLGQHQMIGNQNSQVLLSLVCVWGYSCPQNLRYSKFDLLFPW